MWTVTYRKTAIKALARIQRPVAKRIRDRIEQIARDPYAGDNNVTKLRGRDGYRLRAGDWRVLYDLEDDEMVVGVINVASRGGAYR